MKTAGLFYVTCNLATPRPYYWNDERAQWVASPREASFFLERWQVDMAVDRAEKTSRCEVIARRATKDIPG